VEPASTTIYQVKPPNQIVKYVELASTTTKQEEPPRLIVKHVALADIMLKQDNPFVPFAILASIEIQQEVHPV